MSAIIVYKQAFQPDVESCFKTCVEALGWEYQPNGRHSDIHDIENTYMRHGCFWCLYENEKLIGMAAVHCIDEESGIAEMKRLYLLPEYQGRGYGGRLFTHALDYAKGQGYKTIRLATRYDRVASLRLIEKNHFQRIVKYDRNEFAELYFELSLNDYKMADHLQKSIDKDVLASYNAGIEINRLHSGLGLIEFERTKEILQETLPPAPAVIYDIGGGYGEYSYWLASLGYEVYLYDLSETNIEMAMVLSRNHTAQPKTMEIADARRINRPDESADAVLLFGPLYHIVNCNERYLALKECYRLLKPKGLLFTAAITRYATTLWAVTTYGVTNNLLDEPEFFEMIEHEIKTGHHIRNSDSSYTGMGRSFFHIPCELKTEIEYAGFVETDIRGVIGPAWLIPNIDDVWKDEIKRESIMRIVRLCEKEESLMGLSTHLLTISNKG